MAYCDFAIRFNPEKDTQEDITKKVLYSIIVKRLKSKKPTVCFLGGDSGEGKSYSGLRLQELLCEIQEIQLEEFLDDINVYTPLEYPDKLDNMLFEKRLKKVNILCLHEAREIIKAKQWQSFLTQAVADVNAMSRTIKRLCFIIISQFIRDITTDIRYTLTYYMIVRRPKGKGKKARLYINVMWKDDTDLEKPKLRKRKLSGYLIYPDGKYRRFIPQYFEMRLPNPKIADIFDERDKESKANIIRKKINKLVKEMQTDLDIGSRKVDAMLEYYTSNIENLSLIGRQFKNKWKLNPEVKTMHDLTQLEANEFERKLNEKLKEGGYITDE